MTRITVPGNPRIESLLAQACEDIASFPLLEGQPDEWLALQAGVPLYPAFFGRDALTAGWQAGLLDSGAMLEAALSRLGRLQSNRVLEWRDEEPGRLPYQVRSGPLARLEKNPYAAYYADFVSPLMYVISLANLFAWTGDRERLDRHWSTAVRILDWARDYGDADGDGYLEYRTKSSQGTKNQGWKDSGDAIVYDDGTPVPAPIVTCEIQGYWYAAQMLMAMLAWVRKERDRARQLWRSARELKTRFNRDFWIEAEGFYGLCLDPDKRLVSALTSNVGHCLATGILERDRLQWLGAADLVGAPRRLRSAQLSPGLGLGRGERHHLLRAQTLRVRSGGDAAGRSPLRAGRHLPGWANSGNRRRLQPRRASDPRGIPARQHASDVECQRPAAVLAGDARPGPVCRLQSSGRRPRAARVASRSRVEKPKGWNDDGGPALRARGCWERHGAGARA